MTKIYSFAVNDRWLENAIETFKETGNLSALICRLLKNFFEGNINVNEFNEELLKTKELYREMLKYKKKFEEWELKIKELEKELKEQQNLKKAIEDDSLITKLRYVIFADLDRDGFDNFAFYRDKAGIDPVMAIKTRLTKFATDNQLSFPEAEELFFKAFPELKDKLKDNVKL